jgi:hypothetical protein
MKTMRGAVDALRRGIKASVVSAEGGTREVFFVGSYTSVVD